MQWDFFVIISFLSMPVVMTKNFTCPASMNTKEIVESCPTTKEQWRSAAERKNCTNLKEKCLDNKELLYHCIMNTEQTHPVEVCYPEFVVAGGYCLEYNDGGMRVMLTLNISCRNHTKKCPNVYLSSRAFE
ncbi:uncharacterized protein LOC134231124, partial [Saccostrea cucullata]